MHNLNFSLSENAIQACLRLGSLVTFSDGEYVHARGDKNEGLSIVESGRIKVENYGVDGKYRLTRVMSRGETFGEFTLFANLPRTHNAEALGNAKVIQLSKPCFFELCQTHPDFQSQIMSLLAIKLHACLEVLDDITRLPLEVRLGKLLVELAKQSGTNKISHTQGEIAELLGVTVLSTHKVLKKLVEIDMVTLSYGAITIIDPNQFSTWLEKNSSLHGLQTK